MFLPVLSSSTGSTELSRCGWVFSRAQQNSWKWSLSFFSTSILTSRRIFSAPPLQFCSSSSRSAGLRLPDRTSSSRTRSTSVTTDSDNFCWTCSNNSMCFGSIATQPTTLRLPLKSFSRETERNKKPYLWSFNGLEWLFPSVRSLTSLPVFCFRSSECGLTEPDTLTRFRPCFVCCKVWESVRKCRESSEGRGAPPWLHNSAAAIICQSKQSNGRSVTLRAGLRCVNHTAWTGGNEARAGL